MNVKKAVITAAARGGRLYPVSDTVQKAMLPIVDTDGINKPIIQIIAEEAIASGIEEIGIICAPGDEKRYIENFNQLRNTLLTVFKHNGWAIKQANAIKDLLERLTFCVQEESLGYGHAVYQARNFVNNEPFLLLFGDYLYVSDMVGKRCAQQLIELARLEECSVSAVNPTLEHLISRYGTLTGKALVNYQGVYQVDWLIEKPSVSQAELELQTPGLRAGYYLCFFGMHVFTPIIFDLLEEKIKAHSASKGSILLTPILQELSGLEKYLALEIKGNRYDTSKMLGMIQAQIALGLAGTIKDELMSSIIQIMAETEKRKF